MNKGQEIVVPVKKDKHNFLNAFFLAKNGGLLLTEVGAKTGDTFNEFTGDGFLKPDGEIIATQDLKNEAFIRANETEYDQTTDEYKNNDKIIFDFCIKYDKKNLGENYVFLIRNKSGQTFRFPTHLGGAAFTPRENIDKTYIVFLEFEEVDGARYYNLVVSFSGNRRAPYCSKYLIKLAPSGREGCSLSEMSKQQPVIDAIEAKIQEVNDHAVLATEIKTNIMAKLDAFKNTVSVGLSPQQRGQAKIDAAVTEIAGPSTETSVSETSSEYAPPIKVNNMFADLPSFTQTLVPGENVCADKMIIEMLKTNTKRPSLFSGGRRYKKTTQRRHDSLRKQNKTKRRVYKNV